MRRAFTSVTVTFAALLLAASSAQAAAPTISGPVSATDIQGVSALLVGTINPGGEATTYRFEYGSSGPCSSHPCAPTTTVPGGSDGSEHAARAAISGLTPDTAYDFRLVATNNSGSATAAGTFTTTHGFGFLSGTAGFSAKAIADGGAAATLAGSHPYQLDLGVGMNLGGDAEGQPGDPQPDGDIRDLSLFLPPGLLLNPKALDRCALTDFYTPRTSPFESSESGESCPDRTQVGTIEVHSALNGGTTRSFGLFNLTPPPGTAAQLGASPFGVPLVFNLDVATDDQGAYDLSLDASNVSRSLQITGLGLHLWGIPWNASHNPQRGDCLNESEPDFAWCKHSVGSPLSPGSAPLAYLTLPSSCEGPLDFTAKATSWQQSAGASAGAQNLNSSGQPVDQTGCESFFFAPASSGYLTDTKASSPSGFNFRLSADTPQLTDPARQLPAQTRTAVITLPYGVTLNPSLGEGLVGCTPAQYAKETPFSPQGAGCPNASKIGDFSVRSPLFDELIDGAIYLAQPDDPATNAHGAENPFDTLVAVYLIAKSPQRGIAVKVAGELVADPNTGQLTAVFPELPQLPYTDLNVNFRSGQRAPLVTPDLCGAATTQIDLVPWAGPGSKHLTNNSQVSSGSGGGPCPNGTVPPFNPDIVTGGVNANVGSYTPYYVRLSRTDSEQEITSYSLVLPKGITGKIAGIPYCPEADLAQKVPSCPDASLIGHTLSGYGVGSALTYASGRIYLAGPYHGAPLSFVTINSAKVGPFDLGKIVVRSAFQIDPQTAQLRLDSSASDPIPHIIDGIPLHLRDIRIYIDRPNFAHNPSSCEPSELVSTLTGSGTNFASAVDDSTVTVSRHFQLLNCLTLGFRPKLGIRLKGGTHRGAYPQLTATYQTRGAQDSNLQEMAVIVPHQMFVAQNHIRGICTRAQFAAENCPANSVYGHAAAYTPLFDQPLTGNVYLRSAPGRTLPDLVADLHAGAIRISLEGAIGPAPGGGVRTAFSDLPDAPIDRFVMTLYGGRRGLLVNSANICATPPQVAVKALAQNNRGAIFDTTLRGRCHKKAKHKKRHHKVHRRAHRRHWRAGR